MHWDQSTARGYIRADQSEKNLFIPFVVNKFYRMYAKNKTHQQWTKTQVHIVKIWPNTRPRRFCVYFCLYGPLNCISFHKFSRQLSVFWLCYFGLISALLILSTICIYVFMKDSFSPDIISSGWLGSKHQLTKLTTQNITVINPNQSARQWCNQLYRAHIWTGTHQQWT